MKKGHRINSLAKEKPKGEKNMAKIEIKLKDDSGKQIGEQQVYELEVGAGTLTEIEAAVEQFKRESLPEIERELLSKAQTEEIKKTTVVKVTPESPKVLLKR